MTELQHVNVKLFATPESCIHWPDLVPVFHRWIQEQKVDGMLLDVADYAHVPAGPGILLIGHEGFYSVDDRANRLGFLYNRRAALEGSVEDKLAEAWDCALAGARKLEAEPAMAGKLHFQTAEFEVFVNDRLAAPNTDETYERLAPALTTFFSERLGTPVTLEWNSDPRRLFGVRVRTAA